MYAEFYNLTGLPFQLTPDFRFFFESSVHAKAMAHLTYGLNQGEGFVVITGDVGAGKTTLVEYLCSSLDPNRYAIVKIASTQTSANDTLRLVAAGFGIKIDHVDKANLLQRLEKTLATNFRDGRLALLIVDEAQHLTVSALEELRMISNFLVDGKSPLQTLLLGQPQFRPTLALPALEQLRQRVLVSYHLGPLEEGETQAYVEHRLGHVGWRDDPVFTGAAFRRIHAAADGLPRKINTLCSRLMLLGFLEEAHTITEAMVIDVAEELRMELSGGGPKVTAPQPRPPVRARPNPAPAAARAPNPDPVRAGPPPLPAAAPVDQSELLRLNARLSQIEERLTKHDSALKRALAIAANFVRGRVA